MRPLGALIFGRLADKFGRRPTLMVNIAIYSLLELLSGFAPSLFTLLILRALFGIAMGGEWGVGGALTMETVPAKSRGAVSGLPCRRAIRAAICWRRSFLVCCISMSGGADVFYRRRTRTARALCACTRA